MVVIYLYFLGLLAFLLGTAISGIWLRRHPTRANAEKSSRVIHFLFFAGLGAPFVISFFTPGLTHLDELVGLEPLPWKLFFLILGMLLAVPGLFFMGSSNKSLRALGSGANAFRLTKQVVDMDVYRYTRNPMSFGYYLQALGIGFISGSSFLTLYVLLGLIPAHIFCLKFFEEKELELRLGEAYKEYKQKTPFLFPNFSKHSVFKPE